MSTLQQRFALLAAARPEVSQAQLARATGARQPSVHAWFSGDTRSMKAETAAKAAEIYGCNPMWLATGTGNIWSTMEPGSPSAAAPHEAPSDAPSAPPDLVIVQYDAGGAMGRGFELEDNPPGFIKSWRVDRRWLQLNVPVYTSFENLCIVTGFGPSMKPRYNPGDPLLCDRGVNTVDVDGVYFFRVGRHGFIKQLQRIPTREGIVLRAKSFNPDYDPFEIDESMDFQVFGKILTAWKSEQF